ncbi:MAG: fatty acid desaturase family protein [Actinoallomurus sp.]
MTSRAESSADAARGSDYAVLCRQIRSAGLLDRRPGYYTVKIAANTLMLVAGGTAFVLLGRSWYQLLVAAFLAFVFTQIAFVGHDAGHRQIAGSRRINDLLGVLHGNLLVGLSYGWWVAKHNRHHANPNHEERDPDLGTGSVLALTSGHARDRRGTPGRALVRVQAFLFFPMLLLEGMHLHVASVRALLGGPRRRSRTAEALLLGGHLVAYLTILFVVLSPLQAVAFILVHQCLFGLYMGCAFAPNHKGMPVLNDETQLDFLRRQVLTSRNIRGGWFADYIFGGLNYQIEHHLFPSMPRPGLRNAQALVRAHCRLHELSYLESSLLGSYTQVLRHLHTVAAPVRAE